jgi:hypothetical protein
MMLKSVIAGEYTAPPAQGPMMAEICGIDAARQRVAQEDVGVAAERQHAFLDARAARIVQAHDRRPHLHGEVHDLDDLRGVGLRERAAEDGEVLREGVDRPAVHEPLPGDDAVARDDLLIHPEVAAAVRDELVDLLERAGIEQQVDPLARGQLAGLVLLAQAGLAAAEFGAALELLEMLQLVHRCCEAIGSACAASQLRRDGFHFVKPAFSQSFRKRSSPMSVSGCLNIDSMTAAGHVQTSAPIRAASTMWIGCRTEATSTSVVNS